jgi:hypothetical protein
MTKFGTEISDMSILRKLPGISIAIIAAITAIPKQVYPPGSEKDAHQKECTMNMKKKSAGNLFSLVVTVAVICLMTLAIVPGVMAASSVNLGSAGNYAILAKSGISTTGTTMVTGNIGVSPIAATGITGFGLIADPSNQFSKSSLVTGGVFAANYAPPTPATMTTAVSNMETAYTDAAGRAPDRATELYAGNLGGRTLAPGVYKWSTGVLIPAGTDLILDGNGGSGVWIFQIAGDLTMNSASRIVLTNGAQADNVYWQIAGPAGAIIGSGSHAEGNILTQKAITLNSGASLRGRALAQTAVTLIANSVTAPSGTQGPVAVATPVPTGTIAPGQTGTLAPGETYVATPVQTATPAPTRTPPVSTTNTVIVGGDSGVYQAKVTGTGINRIVITGTIVPGPGQGIGQASGTVYEYIDLAPAQYTPIDRALISFTVPLSWMKQNNLSPSDIRLNRLDGNAWTALPTTFIKSDGVLDYFTAISPVLSRVAITGQFTVPTSVTAVPTVTQIPVTYQTPAAPGQLAPTSVPTTKSPVPFWVPVTGVIGSLLIMEILSRRNRKNS